MRLPRLAAMATPSHASPQAVRPSAAPGGRRRVGCAPLIARVAALCGHQASGIKRPPRPRRPRRCRRPSTPTPWTTRSGGSTWRQSSLYSCSCYRRWQRRQGAELFERRQQRRRQPGQLRREQPGGRSRQRRPRLAAGASGAHVRPRGSACAVAACCLPCTTHMAPSLAGRLLHSMSTPELRARAAGQAAVRQCGGLKSSPAACRAAGRLLGGGPGRGMPACTVGVCGHAGRHGRRAVRGMHAGPPHAPGGRSPVGLVRAQLMGKTAVAGLDRASSGAWRADGAAPACGAMRHPACSAARRAHAAPAWARHAAPAWRRHAAPCGARTDVPCGARSLR